MSNQYADAFVFAPQKCGTTALYWILDQHPEVNSSIDKEVNFMNRIPEMIPAMNATLQRKI